MDVLRTFLEQQSLLSLFLVIGLGYAIGGVNIRGFALGAGAVLFVGLATGMFAPQSAPPPLLGSFGDRVGMMIRREHRDTARKHFGDSIKGTTEFSYVSLGVGMALGILLGILPIPIPGLGTLSLGLAGGPLVVGLLLGRLGRTGGWVRTMPFSANVILRNLGLTLFLAQVGMSSGPKFLATVQQTGPLFLGLGAAIVLVAVLINLLVGHFIFRFRLDDLLGATCGVAANPAHAVFASKLVPSDRTDIAYAITYPTGTIMKILLLQVMLSLMG